MKLHYVRGAGLPGNWQQWHLIFWRNASRFDRDTAFADKRQPISPCMNHWCGTRVHAGYRVASLGKSDRGHLYGFITKMCGVQAEFRHGNLGNVCLLLLTVDDGRYKTFYQFGIAIKTFRRCPSPGNRRLLFFSTGHLLRRERYEYLKFAILPYRYSTLGFHCFQHHLSLKNMRRKRFRAGGFTFILLKTT